jgi:fluoroquinolone transport system permease protein
MMWPLIKQDVRFQARHGFYIVYVFVSMFYILILRWMPLDVRKDAAPVIVLMDPATVGFFIVGAGVLLERSQGVLDPLFVTPIRLRHYIWSKALTLAFLGFVSGEAVMAGCFGISGMTWLGSVGLYAIAVIMSLFGLALAVRARTVNIFFIQASFIMIVLLLPLLTYFHLVSSSFVSVLPTAAALCLLSSCSESLSLLEGAAIGVNLGLWLVMAYQLAYRACERYLMQVGEGR